MNMKEFAMKRKISVLLVFVSALLFSACSSEASDFAGPQRGLPSLVMLSTPT